MNKLIFLFFPIFLFTYDNLEFSLKYGQAAYYQQKIEQLQKEINDLKSVLKLHNNVLKYILKKEKIIPNKSKIIKHETSDILIFIVKKPVKVYRDSNLTDYIYTLKKNYFFQGALKNGTVKILYYLIKKHKWHSVKRERYLKYDPSKIEIKKIID